MEFGQKLELMISDMEAELKKVRNARVGSKEHIQFVTQEINEIIQDQSKKEDSDPVKILGHALSKVGDLIDKSFTRLDNIERNIIVTMQAYQRVKETFVAHTNEKKQQDHIEKLEDTEKVENSSKPASDSFRKLGTRPEDKLASRKKKPRTASEKDKASEKPKRKRAVKKKKTAKPKEA